MFPLNSSQRAAFSGLRREFEQALGVPPELPRGVGVFETDSALVVELDLPGIAKSDIGLILDKGVLHIRAERKVPEIEATAAEDTRSYGHIEHVFRLGFPVDPNGLDAVCEDGVLRVTLPKAPEARPRRIDVRDRPDSEN